MDSWFVFPTATLEAWSFVGAYEMQHLWGPCFLFGKAFRWNLFPRNDEPTGANCHIKLFLPPASYIVAFVRRGKNYDIKRDPRRVESRCITDHKRINHCPTRSTHPFFSLPPTICNNKKWLKTTPSPSLCNKSPR